MIYEYQLYPALIGTFRLSFSHTFWRKTKKKFFCTGKMGSIQCHAWWSIEYNSLSCSLRTRRYIHHVTHKHDFLQNEVLDSLVLWGM